MRLRNKSCVRAVCRCCFAALAAISMSVATQRAGRGAAALEIQGRREARLHDGPGHEHVGVGADRSAQMNTTMRQEMNMTWDVQGVDEKTARR